jgi:hypothetical protein
MKPENIAKLTDVVDLRQLMLNARARQREDIYDIAFKRLCDLEGSKYDDPLEQEFHSILAAYEQLLTEKNGKTTKANRTRQKMVNKGMLQCLVDWALGPPTEGFELLIEKGMPELTAEHLVIKYAVRFEKSVVEAARAHLEVAIDR